MSQCRLEVNTPPSGVQQAQLSEGDTVSSNRTGVAFNRTSAVLLAIIAVARHTVTRAAAWVKRDHVCPIAAVVSQAHGSAQLSQDSSAQGIACEGSGKVSASS